MHATNNIARQGLKSWTRHGRGNKISKNYNQHKKKVFFYLGGVHFDLKQVDGGVGIILVSFSLNFFQCNYVTIDLTFSKIIKKYVNFGVDFAGKKFYNIDTSYQFYNTFFFNVIMTLSL